MGLPISEKWARETFGLREPAEGETLLKFPEPKNAPDVAVPNKDAPLTASALVTAQGAIATAVDGLVDDGRAQSQMDVMLGDLMEAIAQARSLNDIRDILGTMADQAPDDSLRELVGRLMFNARLAGEVGAELT